MILTILRFTPAWVWLLLAALVALGVAQLRPRSLTRTRLLGLPAALLALGLLSALPGFVQRPATAVLWAAAALAAARFGRRLAPRDARYDPSTARWQVPGSALPLVLILCIFSVKYAVAVAWALNPAWRDATVSLSAVALLYGGFSGLFAGRAWALLQRAAPTRSGRYTMAADA
jgi:hypothetical protein